MTYLERFFKSSKGLLTEYYLFAVSIVVLLFVWELLTRVFSIPPYILPPPSKVLVKIFTFRGLLISHAWVTIREIIAGFVLGSVIGITISISMFYSRKFEKIMYPYIISSQVFPKEALAPLFIVWLGLGILPKIVIAALISLFPMIINTYRGLKTTDPVLIDVMHSLSAREPQIFFKLRLPGALPYIFSAFKICVTLSVIGAIVGEFVGSGAGLGHLIQVAQAEFSTDLIFASLFVIGVIGLLLFVLVEVLERVFLRKHEKIVSYGLR